MADWTPKSAVAVDDDDWMPASAKVPVRAHSRAVRKKGLGETAAGLLPAAGGLVGGLVGGAGGTVFGLGFGGVPGAIGGAAVGGAGGEAAKQLVQRAMGLEAPETAGQAALQIGQEGATQGVLEGGGRAVSGLVQIGGRPLMQWAIKSTPEVARVAVREGILGTRKGLRKVLAKIGESADNTRVIIARATRRGSTYQSADIVTEVARRMMPDIAGQPLVSPDLRKLQAMSRMFLRDHPGLVPATMLQKIKQSADDLAAPIYATIARKEPITASQRLAARWYKELADHARELLEAIPGVQQSNARTAELIGVKEALEPVVRKGPGLGARIAGRAAGPAIGATVGAAIPGSAAERTKRGLEGAVVGGLATSPAFLSYLALGANNPLLLTLLTQAPRGTQAVSKR